MPRASARAPGLTAWAIGQSSVLAQHTAGKKQVENLAAIGRKFRRVPHREGARPRQSDLDHTIDPSRARRHHQDAIGKKDSFRHAMRDEKHANTALAADLL